MPRRPSPITYTCTVCGWSKTVAPMSDALKPWEYFDRCPACGHHDLKMESASTMECAAETEGFLTRVLGWILKSR